MNSHWLGRLNYEAGLKQQEELHVQIREGEAEEQILHLEHEPVYTMGRSRDQSSLQAQALLPHPVHVISRGGQATFHGPGQLVSYPLVNLDKRGRDLHAYLRCLEEALICACQEVGVAARRREGLTGIWVAERKLASIGVGVRRWVTLHGLAINVGAESLQGFAHITPCGLSGVAMTCLVSEGADEDLSVEGFAQVLQPFLVAEIGRLGA